MDPMKTKKNNLPASGWSGYFEETLRKYDRKVLVYNKFSIVYMQTFGIRECRRELFTGPFFTEDPNHIDKQIFIVERGRKAPVTRYKLPGFEFVLELENPYKVKIEGRMFVEMSVFLDRTVTLTYRMMVDGEVCSASFSLVTDHLIALVSLNLGAEHWSSDKTKTASNINLEEYSFSVRKLLLDENGNRLDVPGETLTDGDVFGEVRERYKKAVLKGQQKLLYKDYNFTFIDIWEDVNTFDGSLQAISDEGDMISFIENRCKKELVGLMTQYPQEWPYRTEDSFDEVCGENIAIDTDDLVLVNTSICMVFGTYGRRGEGSSTDWEEHLKERARYHVCWPEYMLILEMVLAKKYTIAAVRDILLRSASSSTVKDARISIEQAALLGLEITHLLLRLDAVYYSKFMSHKIMFDRTIRRLEVEKDEQNLRMLMDKVDTSLSKLCDVKGVQQSATLNIFLAAISVASLLQVVFQDPEIPVFKLLGGGWSRSAGVMLQWLAWFLIVMGVLFVLYLTVCYDKWKPLGKLFGRKKR